jgi:glycosyltransferase involved in cell wall biosynthesis
LGEIVNGPLQVNPAITVLMSVYNGAFWLNEAITSVLNQTFTDFEFIIVDDGSTDQSLDIIKRFQQIDSRIVVISKPNTGLIDSLNCGSHRAQGKYIARMDADDICKLYRLQKQVEFLEANPKIALVSGAMEYIDEKGNVFGRTYPITSPEKIRNKIFQISNVIVHPAVMMRRDVFVDCGEYCEGLTTVEDQHLWMKFLRRGYHLAMLRELMISYRVSGKAISNQKRSEEQIRLMKEILEYDEPPQELIDAFCREVEKNKKRLVSYESRKSQIENSIHYKIWRISRKLRISDKVTEIVVCGLQNILSSTQKS